MVVVVGSFNLIITTELNALQIRISPISMEYNHHARASPGSIDLNTEYSGHYSQSDVLFCFGVVVVVSGNQILHHNYIDRIRK